VRHRVGLDERPVLVIDIGGGSTEVAVGDADRDLFLDSLKLGALRLAADRFGLEREEPVGGEDYRELKRAIEVTSVYAAQEVRSLAPVAAYGTSGTIRNLVAVAARAVRGEDGDPTAATLPELRKAAKLLRGLPLSQRRAVAGLAPERADVVVAGAAVLETLLDACGVTEIRAVEQCGVREGLLFEEIQSGGDGGTVHRRAVRERSVAGLARVARVDERHAAKVRELALQLFDSAARAGLHRLGEGERELLGFAATLHDAGASVSYTDHHVHSAYLISNSDLLGFDQAEIDLMATVALLHRKAMAAGRYPGHPLLGRRAARTARTLAVLLRIGELLDRGHEGAVAEARLARAGRDAVRLEIVPAGDCRLEEWGLEARRRALEKGLGHRLEIVVLGDGSAAGAAAAGGSGASAAAAARTPARKRPA
jgi:exopolyphosphatase/guanosine-5'-triphosphate,3'-diphosphate pyrophosphatase